MTDYEIREANRYYWIVKGTLIPESWEEAEVERIYISYFKRIWGNHENIVHENGFEAAYEIIAKKFQPLIEQLDAFAPNYDYKSQLQERVQVGHGVIPDYSIVREEGPDHDKTFWVTLKVIDVKTEGSGKSKKAAEQDAARKALKLFSKNQD